MSLKYIKIPLYIALYQTLKRLTIEFMLQKKLLDITKILLLFELGFEDDPLIFFDCDDILIDEEICLLVLSRAEQWIELECFWDWWYDIDNEGEDDLLCWLTVKNLLSEDDICMLQLSCFEQSDELESLLNWWKVFELGIEEDSLISFDDDDSWIDEDICLLSLSWAEL